MEELVTRKRRLSSSDQNVVAAVGSESTIERKTKKTRLYCGSCLSIGFSFYGDLRRPLSCRAEHYVGRCTCTV